MKTTARKIIFLFKGADGFATAIVDALQPNPSSAACKRSEESFELSLERYGIKDCKASGNIIHFADSNGVQQVSILLLEEYQPPVLACAVNEVLAILVGENLSDMPTLILPCFLTASKLKLENKKSSPHDKMSLYGIQVGSETSVTRALATRTHQPSSLQILHEPLACFLQLVRVLKIPAFVLIGQSAERPNPKTSGEELQVIFEIGEVLASISSLCFLRERIVWTPTKISREKEEPWHALYG